LHPFRLPFHVLLPLHLLLSALTASAPGSPTMILSDTAANSSTVSTIQGASGKADFVFRAWAETGQLLDLPGKCSHD